MVSMGKLSFRYCTSAAAMSRVRARSLEHVANPSARSGAKELREEAGMGMKKVGVTRMTMRERKLRLDTIRFKTDRRYTILILGIKTTTGGTQGLTIRGTRQTTISGGTTLRQREEEKKMMRGWKSISRMRWTRDTRGATVEEGQSTGCPLMKGV
jgi:hypothetical protein